MNNCQTPIKFTIIFLLLFIGFENGSSAEEQISDPFTSTDEQRDTENENKRAVEIMRFGKTGFAAISEFQKAIVVGYEASPPELYGFSGNAGGLTLKKYKLLSMDEATLLKNMLLDHENLISNYLEQYTDLHLVWEKGEGFKMQGVEFTDGLAFLRVYFTSDGQWCILLASSGETSGTWKCSPKLKSHAEALIKKLKSNE